MCIEVNEKEKTSAFCFPMTLYSDPGKITRHSNHKISTRNNSKRGWSTCYCCFFHSRPTKDNQSEYWGKTKTVYLPQQQERFCWSRMWCWLSGFNEIIKEPVQTDSNLCWTWIKRIWLERNLVFGIAVINIMCPWDEWFTNWCYFWIDCIQRKCLGHSVNFNVINYRHY